MFGCVVHVVYLHVPLMANRQTGRKAIEAQSPPHPGSFCVQYAASPPSVVNHTIGACDTPPLPGVTDFLVQRDGANIHTAVAVLK
mmetsp:Transcript_7413/g.16871  ORF Transcript_7413/g.16871 Transcript_7413/m.16871 type:complete len:85 (+) Transcript_7413:1117-1371(+)